MIAAPPHPRERRGARLALAARLRVVAALVLALCLLASTRLAAAGEKEDANVVATVDKILASDVANANFGEAKKKLRALVDRCRRGCSGPAVARIYVAIGLVAAQIGQADEAKTAWSDAFSVDPNAQLPATGVAPALRQQFEQAQKAWLTANPQQDDAQKAGWVNKQAFELHKAALAAEAESSWAECIEKDKSALTMEENLRARVHLAFCEAKAGKVVDALRDNAKALEAARAKQDAVTAKVVQERVTELLPRLAHVKFEAPKEVEALKVTFDDRSIPTERLTESFTIDPGPHTVHAEGVLRGVRVQFDDKTDVKEGETAVVKITLKPAALTQGQLQCMVSAKTQEEIALCLPREGKPLVVRAGLDVSAYTDTTSTHVITPGVRGSIASPTGGWNLGANYLVDVVTSASPDVVSTASRRFHDVRHAVGATGGYKPGAYGFQLSGNYSTESDYVSRTLGGTVLGDFWNKQITPSLGYAYTWDTIGRAGTDYDVFGKPFNTHEISAGTSFVLTPMSLLVTGATVSLESGDQSKPYRYIALFEPGVSVPIGASAEQVNANRLPIKPLEQLPLDRQRYSIGARYVLRTRTNATLRLEGRAYTDSWGTHAGTVDGRYMMDVSGRVRLWPHLRLHGQTGAGFYNRIYGATLNSDGSATIPQFRTSDRELSPMGAATVGGGLRLALTAPGSKFQLGLVSTADGLFNYYLNSLFIRHRIAVYGTLGIEAEFE